MEIMFKGKGYIILPIVTHSPEIEQEQNNEEFTTINGIPLNLLGGRTLKHFTISSFFPSKRYFFQSTPFLPLQTYINFFDKNRDEVVRVICIAKNGIVFNMTARVKFSYILADKGGDIPYTIDITEYVDPNKKRGVLYDYI